MKKHGFTLIEVLSVIIILAILSIITTPIFIYTINSARQATFLRSVDNIIDAANLQYSKTFSNSFEMAIVNNEFVTTDTLSLKGQKPDYALINVNENGQIEMYIYNEYIKTCVTKAYDDSEYTVSEKDTYQECMDMSAYIVADLYSQVTDPNPGIIFGDALTEDYANQTTAHIKSIEDLVALSNLAKTNNFSGKTVNLSYNLDFSNDVSYINPNTTIYGDINGNSIVEGLKIELTTASGFYPIGNTGIGFAGTFNGNGLYINNLYISRSSRSYVGLFGYTTNGTIRGINLLNINVVGNNSTGGLLGFGSGNVTSSIVKGNVQGLEGTGGVIGRSHSSTILNASNLVFEGNVIGTAQTAGVYGYKDASSGLSNALYNMGGTLVGTTNVFRVVGVYTPTNTACNQTVTINGVTVDPTHVYVSVNGMHGLNLADSTKNDLNNLETAGLDTVIGLDNDSDGYYFSYNASNEIIVTKAGNLSITMAGSGTTVDPYQIENYGDLLEASYNPTVNYKLMNDININNQKIYMLSSNQNRTTAKFDGNGKTISNFTIDGVNNTGLFGYVSSTGIIENINFNNVNINGNSNTGLVGYLATGTIRGINLLNVNVTGKNSTGGLLGFGSGNVTSSIVKGNVQGLEGTGGVIGRSHSSTILNASNLVFEGNVIGTAQTAGVYGYKDASSGLSNALYNMGGTLIGTTNVLRVVGVYTPTNTACNETVTINGTTVDPTHVYVSVNGMHGLNFKNSTKNDINTLETAGLDTVIGLDNDSDGYYFSYNASNEIVVTKAGDLSITMAGSGTVIDPYQIENYEDLLEASYNPTVNYKLMNDININNQKIYMLSSNQNRTTAKFDGNGKTISNFTINGVNNTGLFGYVSSTGIIENINFNNVNINGNSNTGLVSYLTSGIVRGINAKNMTVTGKNNTGSIVGYSSSGNINNIYSQGVIHGAVGVGGVIGYTTGTSNVSFIMSLSTITGTSEACGLIGYKSNSSGIFNGFVNLGGNIIGAGNSFRVLGPYGGSTNIIANRDILVNNVLVTTSAWANINGFAGANKTPTELLNQSTYTAIGFNFTDTTPGTYIWKMSGSDIWVERN